MKQHVNRYLFRLFGMLLLLAVCPLSAVADDEETEEQEWRDELCQELDRLCASSLFETTQLGLCVYDLTADTMLYAVNARQRMRPASTMKLLTSITALSVLGGSHTFQTTLYHTGAVNNRVLQGDLYVVGGFDPRFGKDDLYAFAEEIKLMGVDSIAGTLYADVSFKDTLRWGEGWCWDDEAERLTPLLYQGKDCFMEQFVRALSEQGIASSGVIGQAVCPADAFYITKRAHAIDQILMPMMKESDNLYAESMFYQLAARSGVPYASARQAVNYIRTLIRELGYDADLYRIADGSGLSLYTYLSPELEVAFLRYAHQHNPIFTHLYPSLPIAGRDGTLKSRMKRGKAYKNVRAKTGSVSAVASLAGYAQASNDHMLAFCIINQGLVKLKSGRDFQDAVCEALCR